MNHLLHEAAGTELSELISMSTLRAMTQAYYSPVNLGHFGLALRSYAHFTSPIRRYADLIVHRALVTAHGWGDDGLSPQDIEHLEATAKQISEAERRSMVAERDTNDRYLAAFLSDRIGAEFAGRISGVQAFVVFVRLEYFRYDRDEQVLTGSDTGTQIGLGQRVTVRLAEAVPVTGGLILELLSLEGEPRRVSRRPAPGGRGAPKKRKFRKAPRKR